MKESDILHETENLALVKIGEALEVWLHDGTHSVSVGKPKSVEAGKIFMERAEKHPDNLKKMHSVFSLENKKKKNS